jgi:hypothetical protein
MPFWRPRPPRKTDSWSEGSSIVPLPRRECAPVITPKFLWIGLHVGHGFISRFSIFSEVVLQAVAASVASGFGEWVASKSLCRRGFWRPVINLGLPMRLGRPARKAMKISQMENWHGRLYCAAGGGNG